VLQAQSAAGAGSRIRTQIEPEPQMEPALTIACLHHATAVLRGGIVHRGSCDH